MTGVGGSTAVLGPKATGINYSSILFDFANFDFEIEEGIAFRGPALLLENSGSKWY